MSGDPAMAKMQTRALFDRLASDYDVAGPGCFAYFGQRLVATVGIEPGQRVLDVATGRGAVLFPAAEGVGRGARLSGSIWPTRWCACCARRWRVAAWQRRCG